ncbi:MAG: hypothetical protein KatS3mg012_1769 [Gaiellaceae bacterium]|jgi:hypothetical protein|nr:MAG: hypothetical protein KatS3mg012_1769 [Gaiellaceae bacterium]
MRERFVVDKRRDRIVRRRDDTHGPDCSDRESGQAMVEFALVLFPLLLLVAGILHFGIGLNYWLDMNRLSNQGARWAAVNRWPGCPADQSQACPTTLQAYIRNAAVSQGLRDSSTVTICFPQDSAYTAGSVGGPVKVRITSPFRLVRLFPSFTLTARTTMRLEQKATRYTADVPQNQCGT